MAQPPKLTASRMLALVHHILLRQDVVAFEAAALALAGDSADPFER